MEENENVVKELEQSLESAKEVQRKLEMELENEEKRNADNINQLKIEYDDKLSEMEEQKVPCLCICCFVCY